MPSDYVSEFLDQLARYRNLTLNLLHEWLPTKEPQCHLYDLVRQHMQRTGKGLRPALCLATCASFGGRAEDALNSAAAIELLHNAFLVHDDIEDESDFRRDHPTMHAQHGIPLAVNAGDAMQALSMRLLRNNLPLLGPATTWSIFEEFDHMLLCSLEGQAMELGWIRENRCDVSEQDYFLMTLSKTCWYSFIHPCRIGALIARPHALELDRFNRFGYYLGMAFQIQDDILNLTGTQQTYGKEIGGDLYEGKRTLMLAQLFRSCSRFEKARLRDILAKSRSQRLDREIVWLSALLDQYGSIEFARSIASRLLAEAERAFLEAYSGTHHSADKKFILNSMRFMIERQA